MDKKIGISARGAEEEKLLLIEDIAHQEQHMAEAIEKHPELVDELGKELDKLRKTRQRAVKIFGGNKINPDFSCSLKHSGMSHLRGQEILNNAVRIEPEDARAIAELNSRLADHRDFAVKHFLSGNSKEADDECIRCKADLEVFDSENSLNQAQNLNTGNNPITIKQNIETGDNQMANIQKEFQGYAQVQGGQLLGQGGVWAAQAIETKLTPENSTGFFRTRNLVNIGGGLALGLVGALGVKNKLLKDLMVISGSHMTAVGTVQAIQDTMTTGGFGATRRVSVSRAVSTDVVARLNNSQIATGGNVAIF